MRDLTPEECEFIAGGKAARQQDLISDPETPPDIVVTASPPPPPPPPYYPPPPPPPPYVPAPPAPSGGGSGGGSGYTSPNVSAAANAFANGHVHDLGSSPEDHVVYQNLHDKVAKLYDALTNHPTDLIDIGNGKTITASQALSDLGKSTTFVTDQNSVQLPAYTIENSTGTGTETYINTSNTESLKYEGQNPQYVYSGTSGMDYEAFHELGHQIQFQEDVTLFNADNHGTTEQEANSIGRSLEQEAQITLLSDGNGNLIPPQPGYYNEP